MRAGGVAAPVAGGGDGAPDALHDACAQLIFAATASGLVLVDLNLRIRAANPAFCRLLGYPLVELLGRAVSDFAHPDEPSIDHLVLSDFQAGRTEPRVVRRRYRRSDGSVVLADVTISPVLDDLGDVMSGVAIFEDVGARVAAEERLLASSRSLALALAASRSVVWELDLVHGGLRGDGDWADVVGFEPQDLADFLDHVHGDDRPVLTASLGHAAGPFRLDLRVRDDAGGWRSLQARGQVESSLDLIPDLVRGTLVDVSAEHAQAAAVAEMVENFEAMTRLFPDAVVTLDGAGRITTWNPAAERIFGWSADLAAQQPFVRVVVPGDAGAAWAQVLDAAQPEPLLRRPMAARHRDGSVLAVEVTAMTLHENGRPMRQLVVRDVTSALEAAQRLSQQETRDPLTGLANATLFEDRLRRALAGLARGHRRVAVVLVDVDRLKVINDSLGHGAGDQVIRDAGARIREILGPGQTVARLGGDEFAILLPDAHDDSHLEVFGRRVAGVVSQPMFAGGRQVEVTATLGVAYADAPDADTAQMMRDAYVSLTQAKQVGETSFAAAASRDNTAIRRLDLEHDLRRAVPDRQLEVWYQPIVDLAGDVCGMEALVRWRHPTRGLVPPAEFIPLAEENGLIVPIGSWVLEEVCRQLALWQDTPDFSGLRVAVNLSGRQLGRRGIVEEVLGALSRHRLPTSVLGLEITESMLMHDTDVAHDMLGRLAEAGICLSLDDFGTGYSSLTYLRQFPVSVLKIDKSFTAGMATEPADLAIVTTLVAMAKAMGLRACAEGVETDVQRRMLADLGCHLGQGYLWSPPLPAADLQTWLRARHG